MVSDHDVTVGSTGRFEGNIKANRILVSGYLEGVIDCASLEIVARGRVFGELHSDDFVIEPGGQFLGESHPRREAPLAMLQHEQATDARLSGSSSHEGIASEQPPQPEGQDGAPQPPARGAEAGRGSQAHQEPEEAPQADPEPAPSWRTQPSAGAEPEAGWRTPPSAEPEAEPQTGWRAPPGPEPEMGRQPAHAEPSQEAGAEDEQPEEDASQADEEPRPRRQSFWGRR